MQTKIHSVSEERWTRLRAFAHLEAGTRQRAPRRRPTGQGVASGGRGASTTLAQLEIASLEGRTRDPVTRRSPLIRGSGTGSLGGHCLTSDQTNARGAEDAPCRLRCERSDRAETPGRPRPGGTNVPPGGLIRNLSSGRSCRCQARPVAIVIERTGGMFSPSRVEAPQRVALLGGKDSRARGASAGGRTGKGRGSP